MDRLVEISFDEGLQENNYYIHSEMILIQQQLESKLDKLAERERVCKLREEDLVKQVEIIKEIEVLLCKRQNKLDEKEDHLLKWELTLQEISTMIGEKISLTDKKIVHENQRLKDGFETLHRNHLHLKTELQKLSSKNEVLVHQISSLQGRLTNLQRIKIDPLPPPCEGVVKMSKPKTKVMKRTEVTMDTTSYDMLSLVLHWLVKVQLFIQHHNNEQDNIIKETRSLCCNVLPSLVAVINYVINHMTLLKEDFLLTLLEFTHMTVSNIQKKSSTLATSLRRLGILITRLCEKLGVIKNININILCSLIVLQSTLQVDSVAQCLQELASNLKSQQYQHLFLMYCGLDTLLYILKDQPKALGSGTVDIVLSLTGESVFLELIASKDWLTIILHLLQYQPPLNNTLLEKLTILLQRVSKLKTAQHLFHICHVAKTVRELIPVFTNNSFIVLNLQSVLINIAKK